MATINPWEKQLEEMFAFLNELRDGGGINMFAAKPHLQDEFDLDKHQAKDVILAWVKQK
jgi:hypothetical protein